MKKKKNASFLNVAAMLLLLPMLFALSACRNTGDDPNPSGEPTPVVEMMSLLNADGTFRYTVVRGDEAEKTVRNAAVLTRTAIKNILSLDEGGIAIETDWCKKDELDSYSTRYEILIGETNRPETEAALATLGEDQFIIQVTEYKIVIVGVDDNHTAMAVNYFLRQYLGYEPTTEVYEMKNDIQIPKVLCDMQTEVYVPLATDTRVTIADTLYTTEDVPVVDFVITPEEYGVDPTGEKDSTAGIRKAMTELAGNGGGTAFLPAGNYLVTGAITIPAFCTLRGDWQDPELGNEYGTVIYAKTEAYEKDDTRLRNSGLFQIGGSAAAYGLTVYYPDQSLSDVKAYPFTFYGVGGGQNIHCPTVKNCTIINGYNGAGATMDENSHEQLTLENLRMTVLNIGVGIGYSSDVGTCTNISVRPTYWQAFTEARGLTVVKTADVAAYTRKNTSGMELADVEWTEYIHITITDCKYGVHIVPAVRIGFAGSFYDTVVTDCDIAFLADYLDARWGVNISNSYLSGSEYGIVNNSSGMIKTGGTTVKGGLSGDILSDNTSLTSYTIDTGRSYVKPAEILYVTALDNTGKTDVAADLQAVLNLAGKTGGVVYIPAGDYRLETPITVPSGVELRGSSPVATREQQNYGIGTRILTKYGVNGDETTTALVTLEAGAGVNGIRFAYDTHGSAHPESAYTIRGIGKGVYVVNTCIISSGRGVDFADCDEHFIKKLTSFCYVNDVRVGGKDGMVTGFLHNATVCIRIGYKANPDNADPADNEAGRAYDTTFIVKNAENEVIYNTFSYGVQHMISAENSKNTLVVNMGSDNINTTGAQMVIEGGDYTAVNILRYNGHSYDSSNAKVNIFTRLAIGDKKEDTVIIK